MSAFLTLPPEVKVKRKNELVAEFDKGGLLCPCYNLPELVKTLEDAFTSFLLKNQIRSAYTISCSSLQASNCIGCGVKSKELTSRIV